MARNISFPNRVSGFTTGYLVGSSEASRLIRDSRLFNSVAAVTGRVKVWGGAAFTTKPAKAWNGSAFVTKPCKRWSAATWVTTTY